MGREARIVREAPKGAVENNVLMQRSVREGTRGMVKFSDRAYVILPSGSFRRTEIVDQRPPPELRGKA